MQLSFDDPENSGNESDDLDDDDSGGSHEHGDCDNSGSGRAAERGREWATGSAHDDDAGPVEVAEGAKESHEAGEGLEAHLDLPAWTIPA